MSNGPRFDRQTGFIPGTLKVYVDLVDPQNAELSYRIYGPRGGTTAATDAYTRGDITGRAKQDLAVA